MAPCSFVVGCAALSVLCIAAVTANIFQDEDFGYRHYAKRDISSDCLRCMRSYDYESCLRCWTTKYAVIPFYSKRSSDAEGTGSDVMSRDRRYTGCNCCFSSRFSNTYCCDVCNTASKRMGKRSDDVSDMRDSPAKKMMPSCLCCVGGDSRCCNECIRGYVYN